MSLATPARPTTSPVSGRLAAGLAFIQLNNGLWRITRSDGSVLGYIEAPAVAGARFAAKRLRSDRRSFFDLGEFRSFDEALECLRFS